MMEQIREPEARFFRLKREEVVQKNCLPPELLAFPERLGIPEERCHFFLEEISLSPEDGNRFRWSLPAAEELACSYSQPVAVKIYGDGVQFLQEYDAGSAPLSRQFPNGFLLKKAFPYLIRENQLLLTTAPPATFFSFCYLPHLGRDKRIPDRVCIILHQIFGSGERAAGIVGIGSGSGIGSSSDWVFREPIIDPLSSIPGFILPTPLDGRPTAEIPHIALKLEDDKLKNPDGSDFVFPIGEHILDIQLDGIKFPVFWHQKENSPPYRVFFFNGAWYPNDGALHFERMTYCRFLNISGGCMCDVAFSVLFDAPIGRQRLKRSAAWYLGSSIDNFHLKYKKIVLSFMKTQDFLEKSTLFAGSSMGGFMALKMAEHFSETGVLVFNPQTDYPTFIPSTLTDNTWDTFHHEWILQHLAGSTELLYVSPELRNRMIVHPEKIVNSKRCIVYTQNKADTHHYEKHFLPFLHWVKQNPDISELLQYTASGIQNLNFLNLQRGLQAIEYNDPNAGHNSPSRDFELSIIDRLLRFMVSQNARSRPNTADAGDAADDLP